MLHRRPLPEELRAVRAIYRNNMDVFKAPMPSER